jgi:hypothetical protein
MTGYEWRTLFSYLVNTIICICYLTIAANLIQLPGILRDINTNLIKLTIIQTYIAKEK